MKKKTLLLSVLAAGMALTAGMGSAWAYFTTTTSAAGGYQLEFGGSTFVSEEFSSWTKRVSVENAEGSQPVYVRARAFGGSVYELVYSDESGLWSPGGDGWWYYSQAVGGGEATGELSVRIDNAPQEPEEGSFNVVVVYESVPVEYREDGTAYSALESDWTAKVDSGSTEGGAE